MEHANLAVFPGFLERSAVPSRSSSYGCEGHPKRSGTMKRILMVSVAALALAAGSAGGMAQSSGGNGAIRGEGAGGANSPMNSPGGAGASGGAAGTVNEAPAPGRGAQDRALPEKIGRASCRGRGEILV